MKKSFSTLLILTFLFSVSLYSQKIVRSDAVWARSTAGAAITLDGKLNEAAWAKADSITVKYGQSSAFPTSGFYKLGGVEPSDPTNATVKFLVDGNILYLGITAKDSSIGAGDWEQFDCVHIWLANKKERYLNEFNGPGIYASAECFFTWGDTKSETPLFNGSSFWASGKNVQPDTMKTKWDAVTLIDGKANNDTIIDKGYTIEMKINLATIGYDAAKSDKIPFKIAFWDADWNWPKKDGRFSSTLAGWGGGRWFDEFGQYTLFTSPSVTINSGAAQFDPDLVIINGQNFTSPKIDGKMDELIWSNITGFDIKWNDLTLRNAYPGIGAARSGQWMDYKDALQTGTNVPVVSDPGNATIKTFFKNDTLFIGADFKDQVVVGTNNWPMQDGLIINLTHKSRVESNGTLKVYKLSAAVDSVGNISLADDLKMMVDSGWAVANLALKSGTKINDKTNIGTGYAIEIAIDLTKIGYAKGLGDGIGYMGVVVRDGDAFDNPKNDYGTRTWWFSEWPGKPQPACFYLNPTAIAVPDWVKQTSSITTDLRGMKVINENVVWASGNAGVVLRTTDGGTTWEKKITDVTYNNYVIDAIDANTAWVFATDATISTVGPSKIWKTTDGGTNWTKVYEHAKTYADNIIFFDANNGLAFGDPDDETNFVVVTTSNGGTTWTRVEASKVPTGSTAGAATSHARFGNTVWIGTYGSGTTKFYKSTDKGATWVALSVPGITDGSTYIAFRDANNGVVANIGGKVAFTTDGGTTWGAPVDVDAGGFRGIDYIPGTKTIIAVGGGTSSGIAYTSGDGGKTWRKLLVPSGIVRLRNVKFYNGTVGYAIGNAGTVIKYSGSNLVSVKYIDSKAPQTFVLDQNYPNPFNPMTTINYALPKNAKVTLKIYNSLGQEVITLIDQLQAAGKYSVTFNASHLASGMYFYCLSAEGFSDSKKMMLIK